MFWVVADIFVTYVARRLTHYSLHTDTEKLLNLIPWDVHEDLDNISQEPAIFSCVVHQNLHFATLT
jgi:hypothetical protein